MKQLTRSTVAIAASMCLCLIPVLASAPDRIGSYDFSYQATGDTRVKPVQVFDNGSTTFFQFRSGEPVPAIFADTKAGPVFLVPELEGPYVKVTSISTSFALRLGYGAGRVDYIGVARGTPAAALHATASVGAPAPISPPQVPQTQQLALLLAASQMVSGLPREMFREAAPVPLPSLERDSYATPLKGDAVDWTDGAEKVQVVDLAFASDSAKLSQAGLKALKAAVTSAKGTTKFEVLGRDDWGHKEKVAEARAASAVAALIAAGASRQAITSTTTAEIRDLGKNQWLGATVRILESTSLPGRRPTGGVDVADVVQKLRSGSISASQAVTLLQNVPPESGRKQWPVQTVFAIRQTDETVERMVERWTREVGWTLVWRGGPAIPITGDSQFSRQDIVQAVDYVVAQAKSAGYRIQATAYLGGKPTLVITGE
jgi:hypothetical protein